MICAERESRQREHLFITHAFLIKALQVEGGASWGRGFLPLILKQNTKGILGKKGMFSSEDQASWSTSTKGVVNLVLNVSVSKWEQRSYSQEDKQG